MDPGAIRNWATHQLALHAAGIAIDALLQAGVRALPVKGILLSRTDNGDPARRPIADVDLLIRPLDFRRSLRVARDRNWEIVWDSKTLGNVNFVVKGMAIDVASTFGPPGVSAITVGDVLSRASLVELPLGFAHWHIERHDHALLLAIDAFKDKLGRGKPWARGDLVRIGQNETFSAEIFVERAREARLGTMVLILADWVLSQGASEAWECIRTLLLRRSERAKYRSRYERLLEEKSITPWHAFYLSTMTRIVSDSIRRRALALGLGAAGTAVYIARHGRLANNAWQTREGR